MTEPAPGTSSPESATTPASDDTSGDTTTLVADTVPPLDPVRLDELEEAMRDVVDPELGINVVDLGLVYDISESTKTLVTVDMTLTSAACPLTDVIEDQARKPWCAAACATSCGSTGSGCRRGARTRSPTTGASSCARSASPCDSCGSS